MLSKHSNLYFIEEIENVISVLCTVIKHLGIGKIREKFSEKHDANSLHLTPLCARFLLLYMCWTTEFFYSLFLNLENNDKINVMRIIKIYIIT